MTTLKMESTFRKAKNSRPPPRLKPLWNDADKELYISSLHELLQDMDFSALPPMLTIKFITLAVKISTLVAVPLKDVSRRKKTDRKMSPELIILENATKVAHHIWKEAGSPSERGHPSAEDRSRARSHLGRTLCHAETSARITQSLQGPDDDI